MSSLKIQPIQALETANINELAHTNVVVLTSELKPVKENSPNFCWKMAAQEYGLRKTKIQWVTIISSYCELNVKSKIVQCRQL